MSIDDKNNIFAERTYNNTIEDLLQNKETVYIFDVDGTLTNFNYDSRTFAPQVEVPNNYTNIRPLKTMQKFISTLNKDKVYICSRSIFLEENRSKTEFLVKHFDIKPSNIFYVKNNQEKFNIFKQIQKETKVDDELILIVEDHPSILNQITERTNYSNLHVTYFFD